MKKFSKFGKMKSFTRYFKLGERLLQDSRLAICKATSQKYARHARIVFNLAKQEAEKQSGEYSRLINAMIAQAIAQEAEGYSMTSDKIASGILSVHKNISSEVKTKWLDALRSGDFLKGPKTLYQAGYCALGIN